MPPPTVGKNFSANRPRDRRRAADLYETPPSMTQRLLDRERFPRRVLEPACGNGAIVRVLERNGYAVTAYDRDVDFLRQTRRVDCVVTNPPYSRAQEFIAHCGAVCRRKFALLLPLAYLHGQRRYAAFYRGNRARLRTVYVFTRPPLLGGAPRADGRYPTGMMVYAWFVFDPAGPAPGPEPVVRWIDNDADVLRRRGGGRGA